MKMIAMPTKEAEKLITSHDVLQMSFHSNYVFAKVINKDGLIFSGRVDFDDINVPNYGTPDIVDFYVDGDLANRGYFWGDKLEKQGLKNPGGNTPTNHCYIFRFKDPWYKRFWKWLTSK